METRFLSFNKFLFKFLLPSSFFGVFECDSALGLRCFHLNKAVIVIILIDELYLEGGAGLDEVLLQDVIQSWIQLLPDVLYQQRAP